MRFIKLALLVLLCQACSTIKVVFSPDDTSPSDHFKLNDDQISTMIDGSEVLGLKAKRIKIVRKQDDHQAQQTNHHPLLYSYEKIWGKYQWMGIEESIDGAYAEAQVIEIHPNLTYTWSHYRGLKKLGRKQYRASRRIQSQGKLVWTKGNIYLLNEFRDGKTTGIYYTVRINARGIKYLVVQQSTKSKSRRFGKRLRKVRE